jgi:hypothetical protein
MTLDELRASPRAVITMTELASLVEVDVRTARRACEEGQLPSLQVAGRRVIPREPLLALLTTPNGLATTPDSDDGPDATSEPIANTYGTEPRNAKTALRSA